MKIFAFSFAFVSPVPIFETLLASSTLRRVRTESEIKNEFHMKKFSTKVKHIINITKILASTFNMDTT
jgi:hypothetical protein